MSVERQSVPDSWDIALLGEIAETRLGKMLSAKSRSGVGAKPYLRNKNVQWGRFDLSDVAQMDFDENELERYRLLPGDLMVCEGGEVGRAAVWRGAISECYYQKALHRVRPRQGVVVQYLEYLLLHYGLNHGFEKYVTGSTIAHLPQEDLRLLPVPLPPTDEQHGIVAAIEQNFSHLDAGEAALERAKHNLKRMRASVLVAAVEGRLVPQLTTAEHGQILLKAMTARRTNTNGPATKPTIPLPSGWAWTSIGQVFDVFVGSTPSRRDASLWGGDIPWVSSGQVAFNRITSTNETITKEALGNPSRRLHPPGTVMLAMIGEGKTRGQPAILDIWAAHNQNCASIRVSETPVLPEFVFWVLAQRYDATRRLSSGGNQLALNKARVESIPMPLPPVEEQHRIVADVERRLSVIDGVSRAIDDSLRRSQRLQQAVLDRAFTRRLVPEEPPEQP